MRRFTEVLEVHAPRDVDQPLVRFRGLPGPRSAANLVYDTVDGYVLLYGGANASAVLNDTWTYVHGAWSQLSPSRSPPGRFEAGMAYDSADNLVLLFSGAWSAASGSDLRSDAWVLSAGSWTNITLGPTLISTTPPTPGSHSHGFSTEDVVLAVVGALAAVLVVILLLRRRHRVTPTAAGATPEPQSSAPSSQPKNDSLHAISHEEIQEPASKEQP